jgi:hypothetical protein
MSTATITHPSIHVRTWTGSESVRITDMANAGKRGKRCRVIRFQGWRPSAGDATARAAADLCATVIGWAEHLDLATSFDSVAAELRAMVQAAALPAHCAGIHEEEIRGIDAPRPRLTAGLDGVWSGSVDESGVSLSDHTDRFNEPAACTHNQSEARAYDLAARVWPRVRACRTMSEAKDVLRAAGCRLHYWCRVD